MVKMHSIDFNMWMTMIALVRKYVIDPTITGLIKIPADNVLPEFPRDLSKFRKPSIIIQKVYTGQRDYGFGKGYLGQYWDEELLSYRDANGQLHSTEWQIDVYGDNRTQESLMTSMVTERILYDNRTLKVYDYTVDINNPTEMGIFKLCTDCNIYPHGSNENNDYRTSIRFDTSLIQVVTAPNEEFIDLAKWLKISQHVTLPNN